MNLLGYEIISKATIKMELLRPMLAESNSYFEITMLLNVKKENSIVFLKTDASSVLKKYLLSQGLQIINFSYSNDFLIDSEPLGDASQLYIEISENTESIYLISIVYKVTSGIIPFIAQGKTICLFGHYYLDATRSCVKCTNKFVKDCEKSPICSPSSTDWNSNEACSKLEYYDFSQMESSDLKFNVQPAKLNNFTIDFWIFIKNPDKIAGNVLKIIYKDFMTVAITHFDRNQNSVYCIPLESNYTIKSDNSKDMFIQEISNFENVVMTQPTSGKQFAWSYVKCAFSLNTQEGYIGVDSNNISTKEYNISKWESNPNLGLELNLLDKKFYRMDSTTKLILQNFKGAQTELYLKNLNIFNVYIPYFNGYDWRNYRWIDNEYRFLPIIVSIPFVTAKNNYVDESQVDPNDILVFQFDVNKGITQTSVRIAETFNFSVPSPNFRRLPFLEPNFKYKDSLLLQTVELNKPDNIAFLGEYNDKTMILACSSKTPFLSSDFSDCLESCNNGFFRNEITFDGHYSYFCSHKCSANAHSCPKDSSEVQPLLPQIVCSNGFLKNNLQCVKDIDNNKKDTAIQFSDYYSTPGILIDLNGTFSSFNIDIWFYPDLYYLKRFSSIKEYFKNKRFFLTNAFDLVYQEVSSSTVVTMNSNDNNAYFFERNEAIHEGWTHLIIKASSTTLVFSTENNNEEFVLAVPINLQSIYFCNSDYDRLDKAICNKQWIDAYYSKLSIATNWEASIDNRELHYFKLDLPSINENRIISSNDSSIYGVIDYLSLYQNFDKFTQLNIGNYYSADQFNPNLQVFKSLAESDSRQIKLIVKSSCFGFCILCYGQRVNECYICNNGYSLINGTCIITSGEMNDPSASDNYINTLSIDVNPSIGYSSLTSFSFTIRGLNEDQISPYIYDFRYIELPSIPTENPVNISSQDLEIQGNELIIDSSNKSAQASFVFPQFTTPKKFFQIKCRVKKDFKILYGIALSIEVNSSLLNLNDVYSIMLAKNQTSTSIYESFKTDNLKIIFDVLTILSYNMMPMPFPESTCDSSFCDQNGDCLLVSLSKTCLCKVGFYGPNCTIIEENAKKMSFIIVSFIGWVKQILESPLVVDDDSFKFDTDLIDYLSIFSYNSILINDQSQSQEFIVEFKQLLDLLLQTFPSLIQSRQHDILSIYNNLIIITVSSLKNEHMLQDFDMFKDSLINDGQNFAVQIGKELSGSSYSYSKLSIERNLKLNLLANSQSFINKDFLDLSTQGLIFKMVELQDLEKMMDPGFTISLGDCKKELSDKLMLIYSFHNISFGDSDKYIFSARLIDLITRNEVNFNACSAKLILNKEISNNFTYDCGPNATITQNNKSFSISIELDSLISLDCQYTNSNITYDPFKSSFYSDFTLYSKKSAFGNLFFLGFFLVVILSFCIIFFKKFKSPIPEELRKRITKSVFPYTLNLRNQPVANYGASVQVSNQLSSPEKGIHNKVSSHIEVPSISHDTNNEASNIKSESQRQKSSERRKSSGNWPIQTQVESMHDPYFDQFKAYSFKSLREILKSCSSISVSNYIKLNMKERNIVVSLISNTYFTNNLLSVSLQLLVFYSIINFSPFISSILIANDNRIIDDNVELSVVLQLIIATSLLSSIYTWIVLTLTSISISTLFKLNASIQLKLNEEIKNEVNKHRSGLVHDLIFVTMFFLLVAIEFHFGYTFVSTFINLRMTLFLVVITSYLIEHLLFELVLQLFSAILFSQRHSSPRLLNILTFLERYRKPKIISI